MKNSRFSFRVHPANTTFAAIRNAMAGQRQTARDTVTHMKTTIDIAPSLLEEAKRVAAEQGVTLRELVESGLRRVLEARREEGRRYVFHTHTFRGNGLQPGLQEGDWNLIRERSYEGRGG